MKILFLSLGLMSAISVNGWCVTETHEIAKSSATTTQVTVSSFSATQMDTTARTLFGRFAMAIQNQDASANMFCGFGSHEISTTKGLRIPPGGTLTLNLASNEDSGTVTRLSLYCITDKSGASATAQMAQLR